MWQYVWVKKRKVSQVSSLPSQGIQPVSWQADLPIVGSNYGCGLGNYIVIPMPNCSWLNTPTESAVHVPNPVLVFAAISIHHENTGYNSQAKGISLYFVSPVKGKHIRQVDVQVLNCPPVIATTLSKQLVLPKGKLRYCRPTPPSSEFPQAPGTQASKLWFVPVIRPRLDESHFLCTHIDRSL